MNKKIKLKLWHVLIYVIVFILLLCFTFATIVAPTQVGNYTEQKQKIDSLNIIIIELKDEQIELDESIIHQQDEITTLNNQIDSTNIEIAKVKNYYGKEIKNITTYSTTQLDNFFTKRY